MRLYAFLIALLLPLNAHATDVAAAMQDRVHGDPKAPVTIYEYASLTCSHCAHFAKEILPKLEEQAIKTGKAKLVYRDFPLDGAALKASALSRCLPKEQYYPFIKMLFAQQQSWMTDKDPDAALVRLAALAGLAPAQAKACMTDTKLLDAIVAGREAAATEYKVASTPTFVFNDGMEYLSGALPVEDFMAKITAVQKPGAQKKAPPEAPSHEGHSH